jgi:hypothetical protein
MASTSKFVVDFREAISEMIDSYSRCIILAQFAASNGWSASDYAGSLTEPGLTSDQFQDAINAVLGLAAAYGAESATLARLKP